jgi:hypothetical protein
MAKFCRLSSLIVIHSAGFDLEAVAEKPITNGAFSARAVARG